MAVKYVSGGLVSQPIGAPSKTVSSYIVTGTLLRTKEPPVNAPKTPVGQRGHSKALPPVDLNQPGRLRIGHLRTYFGISHSSVYTYIRRGVISPPDGRVAGRPYWKTETIKADLAK